MQDLKEFYEFILPIRCELLANPLALLDLGQWNRAEKRTVKLSVINSLRKYFS